MITKSRLCEKPVFCWKKPPQSGGCGPHEEVRTPSRQNRNLMHYPIMLRAEMLAYQLYYYTILCLRCQDRVGMSKLFQIIV